MSLSSSRHRGLALNTGAEGPDEQRLRFLSFRIRLSALHTRTLYIFTHFMFSDPLGSDSASFKFAQLCSAAPFFATCCGGVLLPDSPKAHSTITHAAFTPTSTAGDVNRTTHACTGLRGPALRAACCSAQQPGLCFKFCSQQRYCSHLLFWGHRPSHLSDIMVKKNPAYTVIKSAFLQLGKCLEITVTCHHILILV